VARSYKEAGLFSWRAHPQSGKLMTDLSHFALIVMLVALLHSDTAAAQSNAVPKTTTDSSVPAVSTDSATSTTVASTTAGATNHVETLLGGLRLSGYAEASYSYSTQPSGTGIVGRIFDRLQDQAMLNGLVVALDKPYDIDKLSAGFHAELVFGQNASVIKSGGFSVGEHGDIPHLYGTLNVPTPDGNGLQLKFGRMVTLMGLEVIEDVANPNWSEGYQFIYVENFTALGVSAEHKFNRYLDAQLRVINGWDVVQDNNQGKSFMGRLGIYPDDKSSISVVGYLGPEQTVDSTADRYGVDVVLNRKFGGSTAVWLQADYGREQANVSLPDPTQDATWWALGGWLTHDFTPAFGLAFRADYLDDQRGARTTGVFGFPSNTGLKVGSGTLTGNIRAWPQVLVRPEVRYDRSDLNVFNGNKDQMTFSLSAAYAY
jgi:hypothetical protein